MLPLIFYGLTPVDLARLFLVAKGARPWFETFFASDTDYKAYLQLNTPQLFMVIGNNLFFDYSLVWIARAGVWGWGNNYTGQLDFGNIHEMTKPARIPLDSFIPEMAPDDYVVQFASADFLSGKARSLVATRQGQLHEYYWERISNTRSEFIQHRHYELNVTIVQLLSDYRHAFILTEEGGIYGWGFNISGELGLGDRFERSQPTELPQNFFPYLLERGDRIVQLNFADRYLVARTAQGHVYVWGFNYRGRLGLDDEQDRLHPVELSWDFFPEWHPDDYIIQVVVGDRHTLALTQLGYIYAWGKNSYGQLGFRDQQDRNRPALLPWNRFPGLLERNDRIIELIAGGARSLARTEQGFIYIWGARWLLVRGDPEFRHHPMLLTENYFPGLRRRGDHLVELIAGPDHTLARTEQGYIYAWGRNYYGQLGLGDRRIQRQPALLDPNAIPPLSQWRNAFSFIKSFREEKIEDTDSFSYAPFSRK
ncbi:Dot/Icm T4SS effector CoxU2 [Coxiella burnetii]|uniref:Dot/Icm T4SS effector CoxU2 n=1 Tax=Coxiella burnetii TaxID=777 RepID=UPI00222EE018|nr:Dot/Icm T4SS effector CoxU2 [Coxiella burnetii]